MDLNLKHPPDPEHAKDLADVCVEAAGRISGISLDYSVTSLNLVEEQLDSFAGQGLDADQIASTLFCFGCYVGEVLVRNLGGRWLRTDASKMNGLTPWPMVVQMGSGDCWNPIGKVFKRFEEGRGEDLGYFFRVAAGKR
jgi:hypothetical protein